MPFIRPTLDQLVERVKTDIKGGLGITTVLRRSFINVISRALAGLSHLLHGYLDFISEQVFPDTAEKEFLDRWSSIWGILRKEKTFTELDITITGNEGGVVTANELYQRSDGTQYHLDAEVTIPVGETITGKIIAEVAGEASNHGDGETISLLSPIANVDTDAIVLQTVIEGEDEETDTALRARLITRIQLPPLGGSVNDYEVWALEVAGVTRAWVFPLHTGPGTVGVTFVEDDDPISIIPDAAKIQEVEDRILDPSRKPVTALLAVFAPVEEAADFDIKIKPNTVAVQDSIISELKDLIKRDAEVAGAFKTPTTVHTGTVLLSQIRQAIGLGVGLEDYEIQTINAVAPADITPSTGGLVTLGNNVWSAL